MAAGMPARDVSSLIISHSFDPRRSDFVILFPLVYSRLHIASLAGFG